MSAHTLLRWLVRSGVELRLVYSQRSWRMGVRYPDGTEMLLVSPSLSHHLRMLARVIPRRKAGR